RVLGAFGVIYMVRIDDGIYRDRNDREGALHSGDVVWIHPGLGHAYGPRAGRDWTQIYVVLEGAQGERCAAEGVLDPHRRVTHAEPVETWRRRFEEVFKAKGGDETATALRTLGGLTQLMLDLLAVHREAQQEPGEAWLVESQRLLGEIRP